MISFSKKNFKNEVREAFDDRFYNNWAISVWCDRN